MYKSPDFIKVDVSVKDNFAAYSKACPADYSGSWMWTGLECKDYYDPNALVAGGVPSNCYSSMNMP